MLTQEQINQISNHIAAIIGIVCNQGEESKPIVKEVFASKPRRKDIVYKFTKERKKRNSEIHWFKITDEIRKDILEKANRLINEHPEYTQIQIISEANREHNYPLSYHVLRSIINWQNYIDKTGQKISEMTRETVFEVLSLYKLGFVNGYICVATTTDTSTVRFIIDKCRDDVISENDLLSVYNKYSAYLSEVAKFRNVKVAENAEKYRNVTTHINYEAYTYSTGKRVSHKMDIHRNRIVNADHQKIIDHAKMILEKEPISITKLIPRVVYDLEIPYGFSRMWSILYTAGLRSTDPGKKHKRFSDEECKELSAMFHMGLDNNQMAVILGSCTGIINKGLQNGRFTMPVSDQEIIDTYNKFKTKIDLFAAVSPNFKLPESINK